MLGLSYLLYFLDVRLDVKSATNNNTIIFTISISSLIYLQGPTNLIHSNSQPHTYFPSIIIIY